MNEIVIYDQCKDDIQNYVLVVNATNYVFAYFHGDCSIIQVEHPQLEMSLCCCAWN